MPNDDGKDYPGQPTGQGMDVSSYTYIMIPEKKTIRHI